MTCTKDGSTGTGGRITWNTRGTSGNAWGITIPKRDKGDIEGDSLAQQPKRKGTSSRENCNTINPTCNASRLTRLRVEVARTTYEAMSNTPKTICNRMTA